MFLQKPMSLLEYALSEQNLSQNIRKRNLTIETQSISPSPNIFSNNPSDLEQILELNSQSNKQWVSMDLFRQVVQKLDEKIYEFETRLDNRESFQSLTQKISNQKRMSKSYQQTDFSQIDQSQDYSDSKIQITQTKRMSTSQIRQNKEIKNDEPLINRQNLFEKKIVQIEEKCNKLNKEMSNFTLDIETKLQQQIKQIDWSLEKFNKFSQELLDKVKDVTDNHTEIFQHLHKNKDDTNFVRLSLDHYVQNTTTQLEQLSSSIININHFIEKHDASLEYYKFIIEQTENDLLKMIQLDKEILNVVYSRDDRKNK